MTALALHNMYIARASQPAEAWDISFYEALHDV